MNKLAASWELSVVSFGFKSLLETLAGSCRFDSSTYLRASTKFSVQDHFNFVFQHGLQYVWVTSVTCSHFARLGGTVFVGRALQFPLPMTDSSA